MSKKEKEWQKKITPKLFEYCMGEVGSYKTIDDYVNTVINNPIWDNEKVYRDGRSEWLKSIWYACHRSLSEIVEYTGMSKASFYRYFCIPRRTFQDWIYGINVPPTYTLFMIQEILGLVTRY